MNGQSLVGASHDDAVAALQAAPSPFKLTLQRLGDLQFARLLAGDDPSPTPQSRTSSATRAAPMAPALGASVVSSGLPLDQSQTGRGLALPASVTVPREDGRFKLGVVGDKDLPGHGVFLTNIGNEHAEAAGLKPGMRILSVNGQDTTNDTQAETLDKIKAAGDTVRLGVGADPEGYSQFVHAERRLSASALEPVQRAAPVPAARPTSSQARARAASELAAVVEADEDELEARGPPGALEKRRVLLKKQPHESFGIQIMADTEVPSPVYVASLTDNGIAARNGLITKGDRIMAINGKSTEEVLESQARELVAQNNSELDIDLEFTPALYRRASQTFQQQPKTRADRDVTLVKRPGQKFGISIMADTAVPGPVYVASVSE